VFHIEKSSANPATSISFASDLQISNWTTGNGSSDAKYKNVFVDRLRGFPNADQTGSKSLTLALTSISTASESSTDAREPTYNVWNDRYFRTDNGGSGLGAETIIYNWKRAKSYFDCVAFLGTGANRTVAHNLGVVPEMIWIKHRSGADNWIVGHKAFNWLGPIYLNEAYQYVGDNIAWWNNTAPTSTEFTIGTGAASNTNTGTYIAYLFATLAGVSKVSSVTHSGTTNVDAGFTNGSRFVLLKRTDATGDWLTYDSTRGIVSGNDPYQALNSNAAQVTNTDYIDPYSAGFTLTSSLTAGTYIYYAIA